VRYAEVDDLKVKTMKKKKEIKKVKSKVQWSHWDKPFQPGGNLRYFLELMSRKGGLSRKELEKKLKKRGGSLSFLLRCYRKAYAGGWTWDFSDSKEQYRITNIKLHKVAQEDK